MPVRNLHFFAPLANVDNSILKIKLKNGFEFDSLSIDDGISFITSLQKIPRQNFFNFWPFATTVLPSGGLFFIKRSFTFNLFLNEKGEFQPDPNFYTFIYNFIEKEIENSLQLLRLFKEGSVHIPYWIIYYYEGNEAVILFARGLPYSQIHNIFHLTEKEIQTAQNFIDIVKFPQPPNYINLAHEYCELSCFTDNRAHAFLSLMISLEVLFKPNMNRNFSQRIAKEVSELLGKTDKEREKIQEEISRLYRERSKLVHEGEYIIHYAGERDDIKLLRYYIRESLKKIIQLNLSKDDLLKHLSKDDRITQT